MKRMYQVLTQQHGVHWKRRQYDPDDWEAADPSKHCLIRQRPVSPASNKPHV